MKTERRHELQTNMLADKLAHWIAAAEPYGQMILAGVVAVLVLIFAYLYMSARQTQRLAEGWDQYFVAFNSQDGTKLAAIAESYPRTPVAEWARLMTADMMLAQSIQQLFTDKANAVQEIRRAADLYTQLFQNSNEPVILERTTFGLARAYESLGELSKARAPYEAVVKQGGALAGLAKERLEDIDRTEVKEFYDWFAKYEPARPTDKPDKKPDFLNDNLENPSVLQLPSSITDKLPTTGPEMPAAGEKTVPAAEQPTTEPAAPAQTEKPAEGKTPSAEKTPAEPAAKPSDGAPAAAPAEKPPAEKTPEKTAEPVKK
jgi:hypothetical protein